MLPLVRTAEMGFLRRVDGVVLCHTVRSCEISKTLNLETLPRIETLARMA